MSYESIKCLCAFDVAVWHGLVSLWAGPSLMLWGGEIEACDFTRYGNREITTINLYNRDYYRGFLVYLRPRG